jgi:dTDP-4-amino-4,6-dideoxygalactose transaminase
MDACRRHAIPLIEDAAEALGARYAGVYPYADYRGRHVGTVSTIGCYSFNGNKIITTGGGGMLTTADPDLARRLKHLSTQAKMPGLAFIHDEVGYNYRLTNLAAALGIAQLEILPEIICRKHRIASAYRTFCSAHPGCMYQPVLPGTEPTDWLCSFTTPNRDRLLACLTERGIGARPLWSPLSEQPCYQGTRRWGGRVASRLAREGMSVPCSAGLKEEELAIVLKAMQEAME